MAHATYGSACISFIAGRVPYQTVQASLVTRSHGLEAENKWVTFVKAAESLIGDNQLRKQLGVAFTSSVGINGHKECRASELSNNLLNQKEKKRHCPTQTNLNTAPKPQPGDEEGNRKELRALEKAIARLRANPYPGQEICWLTQQAEPTETGQGKSYRKRGVDWSVGKAWTTESKDMAQGPGFNLLKPPSLSGWWGLAARTQVWAGGWPTAGTSPPHHRSWYCYLVRDGGGEGREWR